MNDGSKNVVIIENSIIYACNNVNMWKIFLLKDVDARNDRPMLS